MSEFRSINCQWGKWEKAAETTHWPIKKRVGWKVADVKPQGPKKESVEGGRL